MHREKGLFLFVHVDDFKNSRKEGQSETHVGRIDETSWSRRTNISVRSEYTWRVHSENAIRIWTLQVLFNNCLARRHPTWAQSPGLLRWTCEEMRGSIPRIGKQEFEQLQSLHSVYGWSWIRWWIGSRWTIHEQVCSHIFLAYIWHAWAGLTSCGLWITWQELSPYGTQLEANAWPHAFPTSILQLFSRQHCHVGNSASECGLGLFQVSECAGDLKETVVHFWKTYTCSKKLDVQEANICVTQQHRRRQYVMRRWSEIGRNSCAQFVGHGHGCVGVSSWKKFHAQRQTQKDETSHDGHEVHRQHWRCSSKLTDLQPKTVFVRFWRQ